MSKQLGRSVTCWNLQAGARSKECLTLGIDDGELSSTSAAMLCISLHGQALWFKDTVHTSMAISQDGHLETCSLEEA
eukprot:1159825-Pelagomonas_calceolata.AAC.6